jgi:hypothetical protein
MITAVRQSEFARALLDPALPPPEGIAAPRDAKQRRFDVYRNNVVVSLMNALRARFPAVERIVGEECFAGAARVFATLNPPRSKLMAAYGDDFPAFLSTFRPAAALTYLPDVARIEAARTRAWHAADADPLSPDSIAALSPETLFASRISLHPSVEILRSAHPAVTIWAMNAGELALGPVDFKRRENALIARPRDAVEVRTLPAGGAAFLVSLRRGQTLGDAAETCAAAHPDFDLSANLAGLIGGGLIAGLSPSPEPVETLQ